MCARITHAALLSQEELSDYPAQWLVVGLGNPGATYASTRHNLGYKVTDQLLIKTQSTLTPLEGIPALVAPVPHATNPLVLLRSTTYMNDSGLAVAPVAEALQIPADHILVIHDELDLPVGAVKLRRGGNENGHNGLKSISEHLGTREYLRIRMGIARPPQGISITDWVLSPLTPGEILDRQIETAVQATILTVQEGLAKAQNVIHSRSVTP